MNRYSLIAPAKINLYLEIIGDRPDGFHELVMILQSIELADQVHLKSNGTDHIKLSCNHPQVPLDESNLAHRAAKLMVTEFPDRFPQGGGVDITIEKKIPVAAGLAGGSTDAAATLVGMNLIGEIGLTQTELQDLAAKLGSDIPFCISGGTAIATGRGEKLDSISTVDHLWVVLAKYRSLEVSTPWAYKTYRQQFRSSYTSEMEVVKSRINKIHSGPLVNSIIHNDHGQIGQLLHNDLERVVLPAYSQVQELREAFQKQDILGTMMSGSGPTVFALCESQEQAKEVHQTVREALPDPDLEFWMTRLSSQGIQVAA